MPAQHISAGYVPSSPIFVEGIEAKVIASFLSLSRNYRVLYCEIVGKNEVKQRLDAGDRDLVVVGYWRGVKNPAGDSEEIKYLRKCGVRVISLRRGVRYNLPVVFHDITEPAYKLLEWVDNGVLPFASP